MNGGNEANDDLNRRKPDDGSPSPAFEETGKFLTTKQGSDTITGMRAVAPGAAKLFDVTITGFDGAIGEPEGGVRPAGSGEAPRTMLERSAKEMIGDKEQRQEFLDDLETIDQRVVKGEITRQEAEMACVQINRLLAEKSGAGLSRGETITLARQVAHQIAHPDSIDQGAYDNCNVAATEVRLYNKAPATVAKLVADAALGGEYRTASGDVVNVSRSVSPASENHLRVPPAENQRSYASQLYHVVAVNLAMKDMFPALKLEYVQKPASGGDNGARVVDNSTDPPREVYAVENGKPVYESRPVTDSSGKQLVDGQLQPRITKPLSNPGLTIQSSVQVMEKITGQREVGAAIGHFNSVGYAKNWIWDYIGLSPHAPKDARIPYFKKEEDLAALLSELSKQGRMPVLLEVNSGSGFLRTQVEAASGKPLGGEGGAFGGGHVVSIRAYDPVTGKVEIDNTWGSSRDKLGGSAVALSDVLAISRADERLAREEKQYRDDLKGAYSLWVSRNGKRHGKDFPSPEEGAKWLEKWRQMRRDADAAAAQVSPFWGL